MALRLVTLHRCSLVLIVAAGLSTACGSDNGTGAACVENQTAECSCSDGTAGIAVCRADNEFGACQCDGAPDAGETDAGVTDAGVDAGQLTCSDTCDEHASCVAGQCTCNNGYAGDGLDCAPDEATFVADLSNAANPPVLRISGVGDFELAGLSRVGFEINVVLQPVSATLVRRSPGWIRNDTITARGLQPVADPAQLDALTAWIDEAASGAPTPRTAVLELTGPDGMSMELSMYEVVPVSGDSTIAAGALSEVRILPSYFRISDYVEPAPLPIHTPGHVIDIAGGSLVTTAAVDELIAPLPEQTTPLISWRKIAQGGQFLGDWISVCAEFTRIGPEPIGTCNKLGLTVIDIDAAGGESNRRNVYLAWPFRITYFNPTRPYESSYLIDVGIAFDWVEHS